MLKDLFERQAAIQAQVKKYAPIREVFEEFLKAGQREDAGFLWSISPGARRSRFNWKNDVVVIIPEGREVVVKAFTDPTKHQFGRRAGDVQQALINVKVSLPENPNVVRELELLPVWAIVGENSDFFLPELDKLGKDLEEIVPLVRACLPQG